MQYRIWDVENSEYLPAEYYSVKMDGYVYTEGFDEESELLQPRWFEKQVMERRKENSREDYEIFWAHVAVEKREHQHEWYIVEYATGYTDKNGKMIYAGDVVEHHMYGQEDNPTTLHAVVWGLVEDCCISGEMHILEPRMYEESVWAQAKYCKVVGHIHQDAEGYHVLREYLSEKAMGE